MEKLPMIQLFDKDVRHFIYTTFAETTLPPTTRKVSEHFKVSIASAKISFERLANSHHIALAPGNHSIWMAHPFSGIPTNYIAAIGQKNTMVTECGIYLAFLQFCRKMLKDVPRVGVANAMRI